MPTFDRLKLESHLSPISLDLQPHKFESHYPSFCCQMICTIVHPTGKFIYEASDIWFGTDDFDRFRTELSDITRGKKPQARLHDLSDYVVMTVTESDRKTTISVDIFEPDPHTAETKLSFKADADLGLAASLLDSIRTFEQWW